MTWKAGEPRGPIVVRVDKLQAFYDRYPRRFGACNFSGPADERDRIDAGRRVVDEWKSKCRS